MAAKRKPPLTAKDLQGFKYFQLVLPLLERLHGVGCARDKAGNRQLFYDQYAALLLLYFFNPVLTSLNGLQQASALGKVQKLTGGPRVSKGSLSEAQGVFEPARLAHLARTATATAAPSRTRPGTRNQVIPTNCPFADGRVVCCVVKKCPPSVAA